MMMAIIFWLVVWNMFYFPFHTWDVIFSHFFFQWKCKQIIITNQDDAEDEAEGAVTAVDFLVTTGDHPF